MIVKKTVVLRSSITKIPLAYEYDSQSKSVVLVEGFKYKIFSKGAIDLVDLTTNLVEPIVIIPS